MVTSVAFTGQDKHTYYFRARASTASGRVGDWSSYVSTTVDLAGAYRRNAWPTYGRDLAHTGYNPGETSLKPPLRLRWAYKMIASIYSTPAMVGGVAYLPSGQGQIIAVDAATGAEKWRYPPGRGDTESANISSPAVVDGVVYAGSENGKFYAVEAATGNLKWSYNVGSWVYSSPAVVDGVVYFGATDGKVYALDAASGAVKWIFATGGRVYSSPAIVDGVVYVGAREGKVYAWYGKIYALDAASGALRWSFTTSGIIYGSPSVADGTVYIGGGEDKKLYALDAATGELRWSYTTEGSLFFLCAVADGTVYVGSRGGGLRALDAATGALKWRFINEAVNWSYNAAVANGVVYAGADKKVYALDALTGDMKWSYTTSNLAWDVVYSVAVADGVLYVSSNQGKVFAFETEPVAEEPGPPPSVITSPKTAYTNSGSFPVSWVVPSTWWSGASAASYDVQYRQEPSSAWTDPLTSTTASLSSVFTGGIEGHTYSFRVRARSFSGSMGDWSEPVTTTVDLTPPAGIFSINGGASYATSLHTRLNLSATDSGSGVSTVEVSDDGVSYADFPCGAYVGWPLPPGDGPKTVYVRFRDQAGNLSPVYSDTIVLEAAAPQAVMGSLSIYSSSPALALAWSAPDAVSGPPTYDLQYRDGPSSLWTDLLTGTVLTSTTFTGQDGHTYSFQVRARTAAGNIGGWSAPVSTTVDLPPPTVDLTSPTGSIAVLGSPGYVKNPVTIILSASDDLSGVPEYALRFENELWQPWGGFGPRASTDVPGGGGPHTVYVRYRDGAGNVSQVYSTTVSLDNTPPTGMVVINGGAASTNSQAATLTLSAWDALSGVWGGQADMELSNDSLDSPLIVPYRESQAWALSPGDGLKTVYARFRDALGNISRPYTATILLDTTPPGQPSPEYGVGASSRDIPPSFTWAPVTDNLSQVAGYYWRVDSSPGAYITSTSVVLPAQAAGDHTFYVRAVDTAGNYSLYGSRAFTTKVAAPSDGLPVGLLPRVCLPFVSPGSGGW